MAAAMVSTPFLPPRLPDDFTSDLKDLTFTNGADRDLVSNIYSDFFNALASTVTCLDFSGIMVVCSDRAKKMNILDDMKDSWDIKSISTLAAALHKFKKVETLCLQDRGLDNEKMKVLLPAFKGMEGLKHLQLEGNLFDDEAKVELTSELAHVQIDTD